MKIMFSKLTIKSFFLIIFELRFQSYFIFYSAIHTKIISLLKHLVKQDIMDFQKHHKNLNLLVKVKKDNKIKSEKNYVNLDFPQQSI